MIETMLKVTMIVGIIGVLSYLFGMWDTPRHTGEVSPASFIVAITVVYVLGTGILYVTFMLWHKFLYHYFQ